MIGSRRHRGNPAGEDFLSAGMQGRRAIPILAIIVVAPRPKRAVAPQRDGMILSCRDLPGDLIRSAGNGAIGVSTGRRHRLKGFGFGNKDRPARCNRGRGGGRGATVQGVINCRPRGSICQSDIELNIRRSACRSDRRRCRRLRLKINGRNKTMKRNAVTLKKLELSRQQECITLVKLRNEFIFTPSLTIRAISGDD